VKHVGLLLIRLGPLPVAAE